jgi:hypothetical protein
MNYYKLQFTVDDKVKIAYISIDGEMKHLFNPLIGNGIPENVTNLSIKEISEAIYEKKINE